MGGRVGGWLGGWVAGWLVGDVENKANSAQLSCSLGWGWAELGNKISFKTIIGSQHSFKAILKQFRIIFLRF